MKQVNQVWLPDEEEEMSKFLLQGTVNGKGVYQYNKLRAAMQYVKNWDYAVDVGAHCGLWAMRLLEEFDEVFAFEPVERHRDCFKLNAPGATLYDCALGNHTGKVRLAKGLKSTGDTHISKNGEYESELKTLDSFNLPGCDFMKLDCEGYELFALQGGVKTLERFKPVLVVEQKPGKAKGFGLGDTEAITWLEKKGYKAREVISGDYILTCG